MFRTVAMLCISNLFMTYAWYGHLKDLKSKPLWIAILASWAIALAEYCFQVPANRLGARIFTLPELKVIQEIITLVIFALFATFYMRASFSVNFIYAGICLIGAAYFIFRDGIAR